MNNDRAIEGISGAWRNEKKNKKKKREEKKC